MTSIEWLVKELYTEMNLNGDGRVLYEILEEAKEMHKKEIIASYKADSFHVALKDAEDFYQETFVSKGSDFKQFSLYEHKDTITSADTQVSETFLESVPQQETLYTEEQVREAMYMARLRAEHIFWYNDDEIIQSLKQSKK